MYPHSYLQLDRTAEAECTLGALPHQLAKFAKSFVAPYTLWQSREPGPHTSTWAAHSTASLSAPLLLHTHRRCFLNCSNTSGGATTGPWPAAISPLLAQNSSQKLHVRNSIKVRSEQAHERNGNCRKKGRTINQKID